MYITGATACHQKVFRSLVWLCEDRLGGRIPGVNAHSGRLFDFYFSIKDIFQNKSTRSASKKCVFSAFFS